MRGFGQTAAELRAAAMGYPMDTGYDPGMSFPAATEPPLAPVTIDPVTGLQTVTVAANAPVPVWPLLVILGVVAAALVYGGRQYR